ncbi:hypothetical protein SESBI_08540 [Sesbania bispinosa]|nr:hypothetical protein SESBI_08540 [Sesbania bispinosa]
MGNGKFNIRINRINGLGEILYSYPPLLHEHPTPDDQQNNLHVPRQPPQQQEYGLLDDPEEVLGVPGRILWKSRLTEAHTRGRQGTPCKNCEEKDLQKGDELTFWKLDGEEFLRLVVRRNMH